MDSDAQVSAVRAFNRFYTRKLGVLDQQLLKSPFSLSEARVLYELAQRGNVAAKQIGIELGLDPGLPQPHHPEIRRRRADHPQSPGFGPAPVPARPDRQG